ncbi:hypothetical protein SEA_SEMPERFI_81 [Mycobacterium phage SemperFi]|uniref:Uncharacterized protein n=2 Tax=Turbidovirus TaxID=2948936 RepID=A0A7D5FQJ8_9CAUD|nr:hypothetical protein PBI_SWEETIEPIE_81 [Mycobacterium phage SweetiePie]YP_010063889.1 hypothetical protein KIY84_gp82 [Mycobacterium phage Georgie2]YP_010064077.1 hypothetical protein KIY86_gp24 [Mycobacterium phage JoshKayV]AIS73844.1 hypothetical protein PBI_POWER_81 [Mycobacterium phage Power]AOQ28197.1 hypothetical protein SEA_DUDELITTLE_79 [Mycobacterium phage DudeLittle]ATN91926.1 hypothetical protein SEA_SNAPTAP_81 [Mycobacterium phage SnapTap]AXQ53007.1 hypothetical protein SEA_QUE
MDDFKLETDCGHDSWRLIETGYVRTWSIEIDPEDKTIVASYGGSEDFSDEGAGDDHLQCSICLDTKPIPEGWEVDFV